MTVLIVLIYLNLVTYNIKNFVCDVKKKVKLLFFTVKMKFR